MPGKNASELIKFLKSENIPIVRILYYTDMRYIRDNSIVIIINTNGNLYSDACRKLRCRYFNEKLSYTPNWFNRMCICPYASEEIDVDHWLTCIDPEEFMSVPLFILMKLIRMHEENERNK